MARYFFDTCDGLSTDIDDIGIDAVDDESAKQLALAGLVDLAKDGILFGGTSFSVAVRDMSRRVVYEAQFNLMIGHHDAGLSGGEVATGSLMAEGYHEHLRKEIKQPL